MYIDIKFNPAAFKHGVNENDIKFAILNALYDDVLDDTDDKRLVLGFDRSSRLLEILYNIKRIFHKCVPCDALQEHVFHLLENSGGTHGANDR